jgi:hypothetical protein
MFMYVVAGIYLGEDGCGSERGNGSLEVSEVMSASSDTDHRH